MLSYNVQSTSNMALLANAALGQRPRQSLSIINPRRPRAAKVTVLGLYVSASVCLSVYLLPCFLRLHTCNETTKQR